MTDAVITDAGREIVELAKQEFVRNMKLNGDFGQALEDSFTLLLAACKEDGEAGMVLLWGYILDEMLSHS